MIKKWTESWFTNAYIKIKSDDIQYIEEISKVLKENSYKWSSKTIIKFLDREGFIPKPRVESSELSEDQS